ncbi:MAG TPA: class II aldolase/adducin family protein [Chthoniobacterales bacterium]|nr:class II aldolase/adducin family protein [Chthoniobacterales bacterium]
MSETGVVKFDCEHVVVELAPFAAFDSLNACRRKLLQLRMIGVDANGIGFGNLSARGGGTSEFHITGSGTGGRAQLELAEYAKVTAHNFTRNWVRCEGRTVASSESLTHAAVYDSAPAVGAVIHCHDRGLWLRLLSSAPATSADVEYGTPAMALEVQRLFRQPDVRERQIFAMGGHGDGIVAFGRDVDDAFSALMRHRTTT